MHHRPPRGSYRGRRRAPAPPRNRYATVVTTAVVGAGVMAMATSQALPDQKQVNYAASDVFGQGTANELADRQQAADRAGRGTARGTSDGTLTQPAPDLWQLPVRSYVISSTFGYRILYDASQFHDGLDLQCPEGTAVYAPAAGVVIRSEWYGGFGYAVELDHGNGITTIYGHNSRLLVTRGQRVKAGDQVSWSGNTGYSTGPHMHFGVYFAGKAIDPQVFLLQRGVDVERHIEVVSGGVI